MSSKGVRAKTRVREIGESLDQLDHVHDELSQYITYSKGRDRIMLRMQDVVVKDLVGHLDQLLASVIGEWEALQRTDREAVAEFYTMVGSLMRVLVNLSFLFDSTKYPEHKSLPISFIEHKDLSNRVVHVCMAWAVDIPKQDLKLNDSVATLTNLITLLHNYVSYEFGDDHKPFCSLLVSHDSIQEFLGQTVEVFVSDAGTDFSLRSTIQQVSDVLLIKWHGAVEFWNAIVNWNILHEEQFDAIRKTFVNHSKLKGLVSYLMRRIEKRDEEAIYFLTLLFVSEDFVSRFLTEFDDAKCLDTIFASLTSVLTELDFAGNPQVLLLETLVSLANTAPGRGRLLQGHGKPLFELIRLFAQQFDRIVEQVGTKQRGAGGVEDSSAAENVCKCLGLFFRLYGIMYQGDRRFATYLVDYFSNDHSPNKLSAHLWHFQRSQLLDDNEIVDAEDIQRFAVLMRAACSDAGDETAVRSDETRASGSHDSGTTNHAAAGSSNAISDAAALQHSKRQRSEAERAERQNGSGRKRRGRGVFDEEGVKRLSSPIDESEEEPDTDDVGGGAKGSSGGKKGGATKRQKSAKAKQASVRASVEDQGTDEEMSAAQNFSKPLPLNATSLAEALLGLLDHGDEFSGAEKDIAKSGAQESQASCVPLHQGESWAGDEKLPKPDKAGKLVGKTDNSDGSRKNGMQSGDFSQHAGSDGQDGHSSASRRAGDDTSRRGSGAESSEHRKRARPKELSADDGVVRKMADAQKRGSGEPTSKREEGVNGRGKRIKKSNLANMYSYSDDNDNDNGATDDESEAEESGEDGEDGEDEDEDEMHARRQVVLPKGKRRGDDRKGEEPEESEDTERGAHTKREDRERDRRPQVDGKGTKNDQGSRQRHASKLRWDANDAASGDESSNSAFSAQMHQHGEGGNGGSFSLAERPALTKSSAHSSTAQFPAKREPGTQADVMLRQISSSMSNKAKDQSWYPSSPEFIDPEDFESDSEELQVSDRRVYLMESVSSASQLAAQVNMSQAAPKKRQQSSAPASNDKLTVRLPRLDPKTKQGTGGSPQPSAAAQLSAASPYSPASQHSAVSKALAAAQPLAASSLGLGPEAEEELKKHKRVQQSAQAKTNKPIEAPRVQQKPQDAVKLQTAMLLLKQNSRMFNVAQSPFVPSVSAVQPQQQQGPGMQMMWLGPRYFSEQFFQNAPSVRLSAAPPMGIADNPVGFGAGGNPASSWSADRAGASTESERPEVSGSGGKPLRGGSAFHVGSSGAPGAALYPQMGMSAPSGYFFSVGMGGAGNAAPSLGQADGFVAGPKSSGTRGAFPPLGMPMAPGGAAGASPGAASAAEAAGLNTWGKIPGMEGALSAILGGQDFSKGNAGKPAISGFGAAHAASGGTKPASAAGGLSGPFDAFGAPSALQLCRAGAGFTGTSMSGGGTVGSVTLAGSAAQAKGNGSVYEGGGSAFGRLDREGANAEGSGQVGGARFEEGEGQSLDRAQSTESQDNDQVSDEPDTSLKKKRGRPPKTDGEPAPAKPRGRPRKEEGPAKPRGRPRKYQSLDTPEDQTQEVEDALGSSMQESRVSMDFLSASASTAQSPSRTPTASNLGQAAASSAFSAVGVPLISKATARHVMRIEELTQPSSSPSPAFEPKGAISSSGAHIRDSSTKISGEKGVQRESGFVPCAPKISAPSSAFTHQPPQSSIFTLLPAGEHPREVPSRGEKISFLPKTSVQALRPGRGGTSSKPGIRRACVRHVLIAHMLSNAAEEAKIKPPRNLENDEFSRMHNLQQHIQHHDHALEDSASISSANRAKVKTSPAPPRDPCNAKPAGFGVESLLSKRMSEQDSMETRTKSKETTIEGGGGAGGLITGFLLGPKTAGSPAGAAPKEGSSSISGFLRGQNVSSNERSGRNASGASKTKMVPPALGNEMRVSAFKSQEQTKVSGQIVQRGKETHKDVGRGKKQMRVSDLITQSAEETRPDVGRGKEQMRVSDLITQSAKEASRDVGRGKEQMRVSDLITQSAKEASRDVGRGKEQMRFSDLITQSAKEASRDAGLGKEQMRVSDLITQSAKEASRDVGLGKEQMRVSDLITQSAEEASTDVGHSKEKIRVSDLITQIAEETRPDVVRSKEKMRVCDLIKQSAEETRSDTGFKQWSASKVEKAGESEKRRADDGRSCENAGVPAHLILEGGDHQPSVRVGSLSSQRTEPPRSKGPDVCGNDPDVIDVDTEVKRGAPAGVAAQLAVGEGANPEAADSQARFSEIVAPVKRGKELQGGDGDGHDEEGKGQESHDEVSERTAESNAEQEPAVGAGSVQEESAEPSATKAGLDLVGDRGVAKPASSHGVDVGDQAQSDSKGTRETRGERLEILEAQGTSERHDESDGVRDGVSGVEGEQTQEAESGKSDHDTNDAQLPCDGDALLRGDRGSGDVEKAEDFVGGSAGQRAQVTRNEHVELKEDAQAQQIESKYAPATGGKRAIDCSKEAEVQNQKLAQVKSNMQAEIENYAKGQQADAGEAEVVWAAVGEPRRDSDVALNSSQGAQAAGTGGLSTHLHDEVDWEGWGQGEDELVPVGNPDCFDDGLEPLVEGSVGPCDFFAHV